jgi:hypothetical protein
MERFFFCAGILIVLAAGTGARAQTSLEVIQEDLRQAKQSHENANSQLMTTFLTGLQDAAQSPEAALDLYQKAGGTPPSATPVKTRYNYETPTEREKREAADAQNAQTFGGVVQLHCGLMRYAALLSIDSKKEDVQAQWLAWLKSVAPVYPRLPSTSEFKTTTMKSSIIGSYLGFDGWGNSEYGKWAVSDLPRLYHDLILQPLRTQPTPETLDAWDAYIAMEQADEVDQNKWTQEDEPALAFERASDDFAIEPTMDKLTILDAIIKGNPSNDHLDDWITRMQAMIATYRQGRTHHSALPAATPGTPSSDATGAVPMPTPGGASSEAAGATPAATPSTDGIIRATPVPGATPGASSSEEAGPLPAATPGAAPVTASTPLPAAAPGVPSSAAPGPIPTATPGTPSSGGGAPLPAASPGTPSSATPGPIPTATPSTPPSGTTAAPAGTP